MMFTKIIGPILASNTTNTDEEDENWTFAKIVLHGIHWPSIFHSIKRLNGEDTAIFSRRLYTTGKEDDENEGNESHVVPSCVCRCS